MMAAQVARLLLVVAALAWLSPSVLVRAQTTTAANWSTPATFNVHTPSAAAVAALSKYDTFLTVLLDSASFDYLLGAFPGANGVPKAMVDYRPQRDVKGEALQTLPACNLPEASDCLFPSDLPNAFFDAAQYIPPSQPLPFSPTQDYYVEQYQLHNGLSDRYASPPVSGWPGIDAGGAWAMAWYNLTGSYLFQLAQGYTLLDSHFHAAFGSGFVNSLYLVSGRLPYFNNSADGCAAQPGYLTAVDALGSAVFAGNSINRCTPDGRVFATTFPPNWPPEAYSPNSPTVQQGFVVSGAVPSTPVADSPQLSYVMPLIDSPHIGNLLDAAGVSWSWYAQSYRFVSSSPANFSAAPGFSFSAHPFLYFSDFESLSSPYAAAHQQDDSAFFAKLAAGSLEQVTWLKPSGVDSFSLTASSPEGSQPYLQTVMDAVFASPQYQNGSMLVYIAFTDNGGLADHVPPFKGDRDGPGTRVPALLVSPDFAGGRISSFPYDQMAFVSMLQRRFALAGSILNVSRSSTIRDLTNAFDEPQHAAVADWTPLHVRSAFAGVGAHVVSWDTHSAYLPIGSQPQVLWGSSPGALTQVAVGNSTTYGGSSVIFHHAKITGLQPHTTYWFQLPYQLQPAPYSFTTVRAAGDSSPSQLIGLVGDLGYEPVTNNTLLRMMELTNASVLDFWFHVGDISYADTWADTAPNEALSYDGIFAGFMDQTSSVMAALPYLVLPGNHEADCEHDAPSECLVISNNFTSYLARWRMPGPESGGLSSFWYSFDSGLIHWVVFNTETDFAAAPDHLRWPAG